ncbi:MAG: CRTAC1 family protein [Planctomycetes bacterium]|nr:CRTAC1 family protein [Planctomycetota bacterium]
MSDTRTPSRWPVRLLVVALIGGAAALGWWTTASAPTEPEVPPAFRPAPKAPAPPAGPDSPAWFRNVTPNSGLAFTYRTGAESGHATLLESLGGGVAFLDFDGDGRLDVFLAGGGYFTGPGGRTIKGHPCKLYRNRGDFRFEDATAKAGLDKVDWWYTHGAAVADYDRDGWPDLVVTGYGQIALFHNEPDGAGGRRFTDVTEALGLRADSWSTSAGWADLNGDGFPDLYVCRYADWSFDNHPMCPPQSPNRGVRDICPPSVFKPVPHAVFQNNKGTGFTRWAEIEARAKGHGLGVLAVDVNDDARPDLYVANDTDNNLLFLNRGGRFEEVALSAGVAADEGGKPNGSMGTDAADFDGTGRPSLWVTNFQNELHALYRNLGGGSFLHHTRTAGIGVLGQHLVGFGTAFVDGDGDGWEDLFFVNGHVYHTLPDEMRLQRPFVLRNVERQGRRQFVEAGTRGEPFFQVPTLGRGLAIGDLDNDGRPDVVVVHSNAPVVVLRNVAAEHSPANWCGVKLSGKNGRDVVGSTVVLETGARALTRFAKGGGSYLSASDPRLLFGLGDATQVRRVTVKWSWGKTETWTNLEPGAYWELREGDPTARKVAVPKP